MLMASTVPPPGIRVNSTVPPPGIRVTSSAWVKTLKEEIKEPDKADPSIFADADEDSETRVPSQESLRVPSDVSSSSNFRFSSNDSAIEALAAAALSDLPGRLLSNASLGTVSLGDAAAAQQSPSSLSGQRASTIEFLKKVGLLNSASVTTDALVQKSLEDADPTLQQKKRPASPPQKQSKEDMEQLDEKEIKEWDILSGRGGKSNHHPGNKRFRQVVEEMKEKYRVTNVKTDKTALSKAIVAYVDGYGGRFLKKIGPGQWRHMTISESRKKTSQALRETKELKWKL